MIWPTRLPRQVTEFADYRHKFIQRWSAFLARASITPLYWIYYNGIHHRRKEPYEQTEQAHP